MKKIFAFAFLIFLGTLSVSAQTTDEKKYDVFVGYSNLQAEGVPGERGGNSFDDRVFGNRTGIHGVNASVTGYFWSRFGLTADFSYNQKSDRFSLAAANTNGRLDTKVIYLMGGPTVRFKNSSRVTPFVRGLAGIANTRFEAEAQQTGPLGGSTFTQFRTNASDFAAAIGGGLDVRVSDRVSIRLIQLDYAPVFLRDRSINVLSSTGAIQGQRLEGQRQDNIRISVGVAFH